jgi:glycosyltransferase involved in cell wall biosynthesis
MLCLVHGYGLSGSGSNLWTRSVAEALTDIGETVHLVCQEPRPDAYPFVSEAYGYAPDGTPERLFHRDSRSGGRCILHRPEIDVLPVFVRPPADATGMRSMLDLDDAQVEHYLARNEAALARIVRDHGIQAIHVNHVVLMAVAVHRVAARAGIPYAVMPHGSDIEYVVRHDQRMQRLAGSALAGARRIYVLSAEMEERIAEVFPDLKDARPRMMRLSVGVNTKQFAPVPPAGRKRSIDRLRHEIATLPRGKTPEQAEDLMRLLYDDVTSEEMQEVFASTSGYPKRRPDFDAEAKLDRIDWSRDRLVIFFGQLIGHKGIPSLVAAIPEILNEVPDARFLFVGRGPLREPMKALVTALATGRRRLVWHIAEWGGRLVEGEEDEPFDTVIRYLDRLKAERRLDAYFEHAIRSVGRFRVLFLGHLEHAALRHLLPCCDVAVFPSTIPEGSPLVVPEAMASGVFPMGTYFGGMGASLGRAGRAVPEDVAALMRLSPDPDQTVADIVLKVTRFLKLDTSYRDELRAFAESNYDWSQISARLAEDLKGMAEPAG